MLLKTGLTRMAAQWHRPKPEARGYDTRELASCCSCSSQPATVEVCGVILLFLETKNYCDYQSLKNIVSDRARMVATVLSGKDVAQEVRTDLKRKVRLDFQDLFTHLGRWRRSRTMTPTSSRAWLSYRWASSILSERHWEKYTESNSITHYRHNCLVFIWYISDITGSHKRSLNLDLLNFFIGMV